MDSQPPSASAAEKEEHVRGTQQYMHAAPAQAQGSSGMEHCLEQGGHTLGSPGEPREAREHREAPHNVDPPPTSQPHAQAAAELAGGPSKSSSGGNFYAGS